MSKEVRTIGIVGPGIIATSLAVLTTGHGGVCPQRVIGKTVPERLRKSLEKHGRTWSCNQ